MGCELTSVWWPPDRASTLDCFLASWVSAVSFFLFLSASAAVLHDTVNMKLRLLLALAGLGAAVGHSLDPTAPAPLTPDDALLKTVDGQTLVTAPGWALRGTQRAVTPASSPLDCAAACTARPDCQWANFCPVEVRARGEGRRNRAPVPPGTGPLLRSPAAAPACSLASTSPLPPLRLQEGCTDGRTGMGFQQCQLLGGNATAWPTGQHGADITTTAGAHPLAFESN